MREVRAGVAGGEDVGDGHAELSLLDRRGGDVGAPLRTGKADRGDPLVGLGPCVRDVLAHGGDGQHPAARGDQRAVALRGAGVDHVDVHLVGQRLGADDHVALARALRVARTGHHDGHGRTRLPARRVDLVQVAVGRRLEQRRERGVQQGHQRLRLGVPEARVELDHLDATRGEREAGVEQAGERGPSPGHLVDSRLQHPGLHLRDEVLRRPRQRRVGTHASGVRPLVTVEDPLEVLGRLERIDRRAVGDREQRHLGPVEELLDHHPLALRGVRHGGVPVGGHDHALACGEPVVLDDVRRSEGVEGGRDLGRRRTECGGSRRHPGRGHHVLGERLGALELRGLAGGAEAADPTVAYGVGDARDQRCLGTDHHEVGVEGGRQVGDRGTVHLVHGVQGGEPSQPRVAGRGMHLGDRRIAGEGECERVLAPTSADDEDLHARRC